MKIYAIGSNEILAAEVEECLNYILEQSLNISTCVEAQIEECLDGDIYVCNYSLKESLLKHNISGDKIVVLNLQPNFQFYARMTSIPKKSKIYVFNNRYRYVETLISNCKEKGLIDYEYISIPYNKLSLDEVEVYLKKAQYIIGVDRLIHEVLMQQPYCQWLRDDVVLIEAKRVASVETSYLVLQKINQSVFYSLVQELQEVLTLMHTAKNSHSLFKAYSEIIQELEKVKSGLDNVIETPNDYESAIVRSALSQLQL
ncbi:MAG: hypothetical protein ACRDBO_17915 [Lachnospiraceae bacterium]